MRKAVPLLTCTMPHGLVNDDWFPMDFADVLKSRELILVFLPHLCIFKMISVSWGSS